MALNCRIIEGGLCEITQGCNANHIAFDLVNKGYTLGYLVAHSDGVVISTRNNCNKTYSNSNSAIADWGDSYGNYVLIRHDKLYTFYAHIAYNTVCVKVGQNVKKGQRIGYMGNTGHSNGGHVHFEVRTDKIWSSRIDPTPYFNKDLAICLPDTVTRDSSVNQIEVVVTDLNVRSQPNTNSEVVYYPCKQGVYSYFEEQNGWYRIKENMWVNEIGLKVYPKEEPKQEENNDDTAVKEEDSTNVLPDDKTNEVKQENNEKENVLLWLVKIIVEFLKKLLKK